MRKLRMTLTAISLGVLVAYGYAHSQQPPAQWGYFIDPATGVGTARYPGNVQMDMNVNIVGTLTAGTFSPPSFTTGDFTATGNVSLGSSGANTHTITGTTNFGNTVTVAGNLQQTGSGNQLSVAGGSTFTGDGWFLNLLRVSGNLIVDGNTTLGDNSSDTHTINGVATFANSLVANGPANIIVGRVTGVHPTASSIGHVVQTNNTSAVTIGGVSSVFNAATLNVPAGNWLCIGHQSVTVASTTMTRQLQGLSSVSATIPTPPNVSVTDDRGSVPVGDTGRQSTGSEIFSFSSATNVFLISFLAGLGASSTQVSNIKCIRQL